jgi:hypothetical protein
LVYIIIIGIIISAGFWIIKPLLQEESYQNSFTQKPDDILEQLNYKKEDIYAIVRELEFDLSMGKLSDEDFQILKQQYMQEAAGYLKEIDELNSMKAKKTKLPDKITAYPTII